MTYGLQLQDNFNRSDGALSGSTFSGGTGTWSTPALGSWAVASNQCTQTSFGFDEGIWVSSVDAATTDQRSAAKVNNNDNGVLVRHDGKDGFECVYYLAYLNGGSVTLYRRDPGSFTSLGVAGSASTGDSIGIEVIGDEVQAYVNGSPLGSPVTDATIANGKPGLYGGGGSGQTWDDYEAWFDDGSGGGPTIRRHRRQNLDVGVPAIAAAGLGGILE